MNFDARRHGVWDQPIDGQTISHSLLPRPHFGGMHQSYDIGDHGHGIHHEKLGVILPPHLRALRMAINESMLGITVIAGKTFLQILRLSNEERAMLNNLYFQTARGVCKVTHPNASMPIVTINSHLPAALR